MSETTRWITRLLSRFERDGEPATTMASDAGELWQEVFEQDDIEGVPAALDLLAEAFPSRVVSKLSRAMVPGRWAQSRTSVNALRRERERALVANPVVAAWVRASLELDIPDAYSDYGLREACIYLSDMRQLLASTPSGDGGSVDAALARLARFMDESIEPMILEILASAPIHRIHRGAVNYLQYAPLRDLEAAIQTLELHVEEPLPDPDDGDYTYGQADAFRLLQDLAAREATGGPDTSRYHRENAENRSPPPGYFARDRPRALNDLLDRAHHTPDSALSEALLGLLDDEDATVRAAALDGVSAHPELALAARDLAIAATRDPSPSVRAAAARLLSSLL